MSYQVKIDVSPVYDLLGSFMVYVTKKWIRDIDLGPEWIREIDNRLSNNVRAAILEASAWPFDDYDVLYAWASCRTREGSVRDFLHHLEVSPLAEVWNEIHPLMPTLTESEAGRIQQTYAPLLKLWYEHYFHELKDEIMTLITEDGEEKMRLLDKMDPAALIEYASGGLVVPEMQGLHTVILFPTVHNRPINTYCFYEGSLLIQYPVDVHEEGEEDPPNVLLRMTRALSDPDRLRMLRYIGGDEPRSLQDMAHDLLQPQETLMHHLMMLRVAGLLRIHLGREDIDRFSLRRDGASELQLFLESYIRI
ncbi:helix-turn-helix domain-containing protein [Paenibacillus campi]|uniref:winged helix-turn-helix domain-containing protein n=1 Tax=Paenibacillus campi TaxID=3106031 RepID=UPI002AFE3190|nr:helix-turn-helix domain-containing protein [Paenibacillus sp. SGZ-1014]